MLYVVLSASSRLRRPERLWGRNAALLSSSPQRAQVESALSDVKL